MLAEWIPTFSMLSVSATLIGTFALAGKLPKEPRYLTGMLMLVLGYVLAVLSLNLPKPLLINYICMGTVLGGMTVIQYFARSIRHWRILVVVLGAAGFVISLGFYSDVIVTAIILCYVILVSFIALHWPDAALRSLK